MNYILMILVFFLATTTPTASGWGKKKNKKPKNSTNGTIVLPNKPTAQDAPSKNTEGHEELLNKIKSLSPEELKKLFFTSNKQPPTVKKNTAYTVYAVHKEIILCSDLEQVILEQLKAEHYFYKKYPAKSIKPAKKIPAQDEIEKAQYAQIDSYLRHPDIANLLEDVGTFQRALIYASTPLQKGMRPSEYRKEVFDLKNHYLYPSLDTCAKMLTLILEKNQKNIDETLEKALKHDLEFTEDNTFCVVKKKVEQTTGMEMSLQDLMFLGGFKSDDDIRKKPTEVAISEGGKKKTRKIFYDNSGESNEKTVKEWFIWRMEKAIEQRKIIKFLKTGNIEFLTPYSCMIQGNRGGTFLSSLYYQREGCEKKLEIPPFSKNTEDCKKKFEIPPFSKNTKDKKSHRKISLEIKKKIEAQNTPLSQIISTMTVKQQRVHQLPADIQANSANLI